MIAFPLDFLPGEKESRAGDGEMGSEGETHLPFPDTVPLSHTNTHSHKYIEWCLLLLGVLALLMRCERGTEMKQVKKGKRGGSGKQSEREGEE